MKSKVQRIQPEAGENGAAFQADGPVTEKDEEKNAERKTMDAANRKADPEARTKTGSKKK